VADNASSQAELTMTRLSLSAVADEHHPVFANQQSAIPAPQSRARSLDLYRGVAVLLMIAAHVSDAFLGDRWRHNEIWYLLDVTFGFVAPAFLFLSGATLYLSLAKRSPPRSPLSPLPRLLWILALAYWLQIPVLSLRQLVWNHRPDELARLFDSNILHVVALSGIVLVLLAATAGLLGARIIALVLAVALIVVTPFLPSLPAGTLLASPLHALIASQPTATFPLVPYAMYALAGFGSIGWLVRMGRGRLLLLAASGIALAATARAVGAFVGGDFWRGSAEHLIFRLGGVVAGLGMTSVAAMSLPARRTIIERIGERSLAVYVLHLMLVYGSPMTMGARYWFDGNLDRTLDPIATLLAYLVVTLATSVVAIGWPIIRERAPRAAALAWWGWWTTFALLFLMTP
jgi:fucose 4-O-acetylase-like acetyltransferase